MREGAVAALFALSRRQYVWEVLFVSGQEDAAPPQTLARLDGRFEETLSLTVG